MPTKEASTTMTVRVSVAVKDRLERLSQATARSRSWLAAEAIASYLELQEWQVREIEDGVREADAGDFATAAEVSAVFGKYVDGR